MLLQGSASAPVHTPSSTDLPSRARVLPPSLSLLPPSFSLQLSASAPAAAHLPLSHEPPLHLMAALRTNTLAHHSSPAARRRSTEVGGSCRLTESGSPQTASDFSAHPPLSPTACLTAAKGFSFVPGARHGLRRVAPLDRPSPRGPGMPQSSLGRRRSLEGSSVALATDSIATQYNGAIRIRAANLPALA